MDVISSITGMLQISIIIIPYTLNIIYVTSVGTKPNPSRLKLNSKSFKEKLFTKI